MTKLTPRMEFDALLMKVQRAVRGADDADAASALIAVLFAYITKLSGDERARAQHAIAAIRDMTGPSTERPKIRLIQTH